MLVNPPQLCWSAPLPWPVTTMPRRSSAVASSGCPSKRGIHFLFWTYPCKICIVRSSKIQTYVDMMFMCLIYIFIYIYIYVTILVYNIYIYILLYTYRNAKIRNEWYRWVLDGWFFCKSLSSRQLRVSLPHQLTQPETHGTWHAGALGSGWQPSRPKNGSVSKPCTPVVHMKIAGIYGCSSP